jgi:hypothetical protein
MRIEPCRRIELWREAVRSHLTCALSALLRLSPYHHALPWGTQHPLPVRSPTCESRGLLSFHIPQSGHSKVQRTQGDEEVSTIRYRVQCAGYSTWRSVWTLPRFNLHVLAEDDHVGWRCESTRRPGLELSLVAARHSKLQTCCYHGPRLPYLPDTHQVSLGAPFRRGNTTRAFDRIIILEQSLTCMLVHHSAASA